MNDARLAGRQIHHRRDVRPRRGPLPDRLQQSAHDAPRDRRRLQEQAVGVDGDSGPRVGPQAIFRGERKRLEQRLVLTRRVGGAREDVRHAIAVPRHDRGEQIVPYPVPENPPVFVGRGLDQRGPADSAELGASRSAADDRGARRRWRDRRARAYRRLGARGRSVARRAALEAEARLRPDGGHPVAVDAPRLLLRAAGDRTARRAAPAGVGGAAAGDLGARGGGPGSGSRRAGRHPGGRLRRETFLSQSGLIFQGASTPARTWRRGFSPRLRPAGVQPRPLPVPGVRRSAGIGLAVARRTQRPGGGGRRARSLGGRPVPGGDSGRDR